jgi:hypothetical protein
MRWSPDSRYLLYADLGGICVIDIRDHRTAKVLEAPDQRDESRFRWVQQLRAPKVWPQ